jgi:4-carboxymuconolactone decarboxylase
MDQDQSGLYSRMLGDPRRGGPGALLVRDGSGALAGPFNAFLLDPAVGDLLQQTGTALRFGLELSPRIREIVILTVARVRDSAFEWKAHARIGRSIGLADAELERLSSGDGGFDDPSEALAEQVARALVAERRLDDGLYQEATRVLGERSVFDITALVGYYDLLAMQLEVFGYRT